MFSLFILKKHASRDLVLGLTDLAFPNNFWNCDIPPEQRKADEAAWNSVYDQLIKTMRTVHRKDNRVLFLPDKFWTDHGRSVGIFITYFLILIGYCYSSNIYASFSKRG